MEFSVIKELWPVLTAVFIVGVLSFPHCAGMCGPFLFIFQKSAFSYQLGRFLGYTTTGSVLGLFGYALDRSGTLIAFQNASLYLAGAILILFVLFQWVPVPFMKRISAYLSRPSSSAMKLRSRMPGSRIPVLLAGMATALIPCGVLYPVWSVSAASASASGGALIGLSFVAGTIPGLFGLQKVIGKIPYERFKSGIAFKLIATVLMVATGIGMLYQRSLMGPGLTAGDGDSCHEESPYGNLDGFAESMMDK